MSSFKAKSLSFCSCSILSCSAFAASASQQTDATTVQLPVLTVTASQNSDGYVATNAASALKSDAPLFETAQAITVISREQLEQKQATTLNEALQGVSGLSAGNFGRRGFDDVIIRGQTSTDNIFIDGLRLTKDVLNAVDMSGVEQVQVIKGPASVNFGLVQPGGLVNIVSKRPAAESFAQGALTYGSHNFKQGIFDLNYAPNASEKGAFRLSGRVADQDDATDYVYFKNFYISPSYTFDLGDNTDLTVMASYQHREYLRQQGLPVVGTLVPNASATFKNTLLITDPDNVYHYDNYRLGYNLVHQFGHNWTFKQNFAYFNSAMDGTLLAFRGYAANSNYTVVTRRLNAQDRQIESYALDNNLQKEFHWAKLQHSIMIGVDAMHDQLKENNYQTSNAGNNLNVNQPVYGQAQLTVTSRTNTVTETQYLGLYLRDRITWNDKVILNLTGRHDWAEGQVHNNITNSNSDSADTAFTGSASLLYKWNDVIAPYLSYATSFMPQTGTDYAGNAFDPEEGKQIELGLKLQSPDRRIQGSLAWFDLTKQNVQTEDPEHADYYVLVGEQLTRGIETEVAASINDKWNVSANYSYTSDAKVTQSTVQAELGTSIAQIPKHAFALNTQYYFDSSKQGWNIGGAIRYVGDRDVDVSGLEVASVTLPDYMVYDVNAGYEAKHWGAVLNIKNVFDKDYYTGIVSETRQGGVVALGDPRQINFTLKFKY